MSLTAAVTFSAGFAGSRTIYGMASNNANQYPPWAQLGNWVVTLAGPPVTSLVNPPGGGSGLAGTSQAFTFAASDLAGASDIYWLDASFGGTGAAGTCFLFYFPAINALNLNADDGTWIWGYPGTSGTIQNSQCSVNLAGSGMTQSGNTVSLTAAVTFSTAFAGSRTIYGMASNYANQYPPWAQLGTWTVTAVAPETLATPTVTGPATGSTGTGYTYTASGGVSSLGHAVQYQFTWDDATSSGWLTPGTTTASKTWTTSGSHSTTVQARCATDTTVTSLPSSAAVANIAAVTTQTITTLPTGLSVTVDGTNCTSPCTFSWVVGSSHTVAAASTIAGTTGTRSVFLSWSQGGAASQTITTAATPTTYTATYQTQYYLATTSGSGGTITQSDSTGWYSSGTQATVTAAASAGYQFSGFSGTATSTTNPFYFTMNGASALTASFVPAPPALNVTPSSGAGASQILTAAYIDPVAFGEITEALLLINSSAATASACYVRWTPGNHFYLRNDTDSAWLDATAASVQNSRCRLDAPANGAQGSGQTLTVNFGLTFFSAFLGAKNVYLTTTAALGTAPWQPKGTWTVDMTSGDFTVSTLTPNAATNQFGTVQYQYKVTAIDAIDGSTVRVGNSGVYIPSTPDCLGSWNQQSGWDPATRSGTVTLAIQASGGCSSGWTYQPQITWQSGAGGVSKTTTDTTLTCCTSSPISIAITPISTTLRAGQSATLTAAVWGATNGGVMWDTPSIGTFALNGSSLIYTAPAIVSTTQYVVITVHSSQDPTKTASATITLQPPAPTNVPTYTISGQVIQSDGSAFGPISINVTGDQAQTLSTLADGTYSTPPLAAGHYVVQPSSDYGAATPTTYDLLGPRGGRHVLKPFRLSPNNVAPPVDDDPAEVRSVVHVPANGLPIPEDFWWTDPHINARDIQAPGCWVKPYDGPASYSARDQAIGVSYTPDASGPHFVITFTAPPTSLGFRDLVCRFGGKDVVGWPIISFESAAAPPVINMKLEQVGPTVISTDGKYSEDTTIRVTAVDATTGATIPDFVGMVNIEEIQTTDGITLYTQNGGTLTPGNTGWVNITTGGSVTFVAKSLGGPSIEGNVPTPPFGAPPLDATIQTTNYPVWGPNLTIPQWSISGGPGPVYNDFDSHARGPVYDWFQARARDVFDKANAVVPPIRNDLAVVLSAVESYINSAISSAGFTPPSHSATTQITINPYYNVFRIDASVPATCGFIYLKGFQGIFFHEARHAYQMAQASIANDPDQDYLVNAISVPADDSIPPGDYFKDSENLRLVCNPDAIVIPLGKTGQILQAIFSGPLVSDVFEPLVRYALEMDAYTFAANWAK